MESNDILIKGATLTARKLTNEELKMLTAPEPETNMARPENITDRFCPCCKSEDIAENYRTESNGVFGPGYSSWKVDSKLVCNNCGVMFLPKDGNKKAPPII